MSANDILDLAWLVPALPLAGAALLLLFGKRIGEPKAGWIGSGLLALSFGWSVVVFNALRDLAPEQRHHVIDLFTWLPSGGFRVEMGFLVDPLSVAFILFVTYMNLFVAAMLILVLGSSFLVTFLGWEGVGLCSYLLVSFWFERDSAAT